MEDFYLWRRVESQFPLFILRNAAEKGFRKSEHRVFFLQSVGQQLLLEIPRVYPLTKLISIQPDRNTLPSFLFMYACFSQKKSNNYSNSDASESVYTAKCYANMTEAWNRNFIWDVNNTGGANALQLREPRHYKPHQSKYTMCVLYWSYTNSFQGRSSTFPAPRRRKSSLTLSLITFSYFSQNKVSAKPQQRLPLISDVEGKASSRRRNVSAVKFSSHCQQFIWFTSKLNWLREGGMGIPSRPNSNALHGIGIRSFVQLSSANQPCSA